MPRKIREGSRTIVATCYDDPAPGVNKTSKCKNDTKIKEIQEPKTKIEVKV